MYKQPLFGALSVVICVLVFFADLLTPLGYAVGLLYVLPLLLALLTMDRRWLIGMTLLSLSLILLSSFLLEPAPGVNIAAVVFNRLLSLLVCVFVALLSLRFIRLFSELKATALSLETSSRLMNIASRVGRLGGWRMGLDSRVFEWSDEVYSLHDLPLSEVPALDTVLQLYEENSRHRLLRHMNDIAAHGGSFDLELQLALPGRNRRWVRVAAETVNGPQGDLVGLHGAWQDIDEQKRIAQHVTATLESVNDAIFTLDRHWCFTYLNGQAQRLLQRSQTQLLGHNIWSAFPAAMETLFEKEYRRCLEQQETVRFEAFFEPLEALFEVSACPFGDGIVVCFHDITEQRKVQEQLQQTQRLESLGRLTSGVAHDFNNLLMVILGNAEMLDELLSSQPESREHVRLIIMAAGKAGVMTQKLLSFSNQQILEPEETDVNVLLQALSPLLLRTLGNEVQVELRPGEHIWPTRIDPGQLENVLLNLAINARDAMPQGGMLMIETGTAQLGQQGLSEPGCPDPGDYVTLVVRDTGEGISEKHLHRVFEPFYTTKGPGKGTGLGLAMVYGFVKQSGGHITIDSELGKGTTVTLYLPRHIVHQVG